MTSTVKFCLECGAKTNLIIPDGDNRLRSVCPSCGFINYQNPRIVVGSVCLSSNKVLLAKRDIEPRKGYWTIPAGFMELDETTAQGARREAREEVNADIEIQGLLAIFNIVHVNQVQIIYISNVKDGKFSAGDETSKAELFTFEEAKSMELAFPNIHVALEQAELYLSSPESFSPLQKDYIPS